MRSSVSVLIRCLAMLCAAGVTGAFISAPYAPSVASALPLSALPMAGPMSGFVPNRGQFHPDVRFRAVAGEATLLLLDDGIMIVPHDMIDPARHVPFSPGRARALVPVDRLPGVLHFLNTGDRRRWATNVPHYAAVTIRGAGLGGAALGADVTLRFDGGRLTATTGSEQSLSRLSDWLVDHRSHGPGHGGDRLDPGRLSSLSLLADGERLDSSRLPSLSLLADGVGHSRSQMPQQAAAAQLPLGVGRSRSQQVPQQAADAQLAYSTYFGGGRSELVRGMAVDAEGFAYIAGSTTSTNLPTRNPLQPGMGNTGLLQDAFVAKLTPDGTSLVFATYLGGSRQDEALDLAVDSIGRVHLTGYTMSPDFPMEKNLQERVNLASGIFSGDAFATKLSPDGSALEFSTPLGGTARDIGKGVAVDAEGFVYVTGWTGSNFPAVNALYPLNRGVTDAFVVKMSPAGDDVVYSTHLGGSTYDLARDIAVDAEGSAYIVGVTESVNFRVSNPLQRANAGGRDAFVAKFAPDGQAVTWATYLGGRTDDFGIGIAVDAKGSTTIVGRTDSPNFPRAGAFQNQRSGPTDLFVSRIAPDGGSLSFSTYLGGSAVEADCAEVDQPRAPMTPTPAPGVPRLPGGSRFPDGPVAAIAVDEAGRTYVTTCTASSNAKLERPIQAVRRGPFAAYIAALDPTGASLDFGTYLAGQALDIPRAIAVGPDGAVYVAGQTTSTDFPLAPAVPLQPNRRGVDDAFVLKIAPLFEAPSPTPPSQTPPIASVTPEATPTARASDTPAAPATERATETATPAPSASATDTPTATPTAGPAPVWLPWSCRSCDA